MTTFISYSRVNSDFAVRLAKDLKKGDYDVWLDQLDIPTGSRWDDEIEKALEELRKTEDDNSVYKYAGSILIKSTKNELIDDLEERLEMSKTRTTVLEKQEARLKETLKEQETKITEMMKGGTGSGATMTDQSLSNSDSRK